MEANTGDTSQIGTARLIEINFQVLYGLVIDKIQEIVNRETKQAIFEDCTKLLVTKSTVKKGMTVFSLEEAIESPNTRKDITTHTITGLIYDSTKGIIGFQIGENWHFFDEGEKFIQSKDLRRVKAKIKRITNESDKRGKRRKFLINTFIGLLNNSELIGDTALKVDLENIFTFGINQLSGKNGIEKERLAIDDAFGNNLTTKDKRINGLVEGGYILVVKEIASSEYNFKMWPYVISRFLYDENEKKIGFSIKDFDSTANVKSYLFSNLDKLSKNDGVRFYISEELKLANFKNGFYEYISSLLDRSYEKVKLVFRDSLKELLLSSLNEELKRVESRNHFLKRIYMLITTSIMSAIKAIHARNPVTAREDKKVSKD